MLRPEHTFWARAPSLPAAGEATGARSQPAAGSNNGRARAYRQARRILKGYRLITFGRNCGEARQRPARSRTYVLGPRTYVLGPTRTYVRNARSGAIDGPSTYVLIRFRTYVRNIRSGPDQNICSEHQFRTSVRGPEWAFFTIGQVLDLLLLAGCSIYRTFLL